MFKKSPPRLGAGPHFALVALPLIASRLLIIRIGRSIVSDSSPQLRFWLENQSSGGPELSLLIHLGAFDA